MKNSSKAVHKTHVNGDHKQVTTMFGRIRKSENPFVRGRIVAQLRAKGIRPETIAKNAGYTTGQVYNWGLVASWPTAIKKYIYIGDKTIPPGKIHVSEALLLSRKQPSIEAFIKTVERVVHAKDKNKAVLMETTMKPKKNFPTQKSKVENWVRQKFGNLSPGRFEFAMKIAKTAMTAGK